MDFGKVTSVMVALVCIFLDTVQPKNHTLIIENLLSFGESSLAVFLDNSLDIRDVVDPNQMEKPWKIFNEDEIVLEKPICPSQTDVDSILLGYHYEPFYLNFSPKHYTIVVHVENPAKTLAIFDKTVLKCSYIFEPGIYHMDNCFLFIVKENENVSRRSEEIFNGSPYISNHRYVAIAKQFLYDEKRYLIFGLNLGIGKTSKSKLLYIWDARMPPKTLDVGFYGGVTTNYHGHKFRLSSGNFKSVGLNCLKQIKIWDTVKPGEDSVAHLKCSGFEVWRAELLVEMFNMTWGIIAADHLIFYKYYFKENDTFAGTASAVIYGKADYVTSQYLGNDGAYLLHQSINNFYHPQFSILSSAPKQLSKVYSMVYPFSTNLWPVVAGSAIVLSLVFPAISYLKRATGNAGYNSREQGVSAWFSFSALIGENMRNESVELHSAPIRLLIGVWILACFILSAGYAGNLRGFLMNPGKTKDVINSLEKVIDSKLTIYRFRFPWEHDDQGTKDDREKQDNQEITFNYTLFHKALPYPGAFGDETFAKTIYKVYKGEAIIFESETIYNAFYNGLYVSRTGLKAIYVAKAPLEDFGPSITALSKISLLAANFEKLQMRAFTMGITRQWMAMAESEIASTTKKAFENYPNMPIDLEPEPILKPFTLPDLQGVFYLLSIMLGISTILFLCEVFICKRGSRRAKKEADPKPRIDG